jgi:hypothetical protein
LLFTEKRKRWSKDGLAKEVPGEPKAKRTEGNTGAETAGLQAAPMTRSRAAAAARGGAAPVVPKARTPAIKQEKAKQPTVAKGKGTIAPKRTKAGEGCVSP